LRVVEVGGNKRFFDFLQDYQKERDSIESKYCSSPAQYYRRMLGAWARGVEFLEDRPAKTWSELATRTNEQYKIADTASSAYESTKSGIMNLFSYASAATETDAQKQEKSK